MSSGDSDTIVGDSSERAPERLPTPYGGPDEALDARASASNSGGGDVKAESQGADAGSKRGSEKKEQKQKAPWKVPAWITDNLKDPHSWKLLVRCWVATFVTLMLIPINRSLMTLGQAAFFAPMVQIMIPANMPVSIWLMANFTLVLGCVLGWAWGAAGMAASLRARSQVLLASQFQTVQTSVATTTNPDSAFEAKIFEGAFLDGRSSAVSGAFLGVGCFGFAVLMNKSPKLKLMCIFGMIILDILASFGPLFPFQQYTLATIFLLPIGASVGVGLGCILFIFPESLNYAWTRNLIKLVRLQISLLGMHYDFIQTPIQLPQDSLKGEDDGSQPSATDLEAFYAKVKGTNASAVAMANSLGEQAGFLELDVSRGRFSGKDLKKLLAMLRGVNLRLMGLASFAQLLQDVAHGKNALAKLRRGPDGEGGAQGQTTHEHDWLNLREPVPLRQTHYMHQTHKRLEESEAEQKVEVHRLQATMAKASRATLEGCREVLDLIAGWTERTNKNRWALRHDAAAENAAIEELRRAAGNLRQSINSFIDDERLALLEPYRKHFKINVDGSLHLDEESEMMFAQSSRPLFIAFVWVYSFSKVAQQVHTLAETFHDVASIRQKNKIWLPSGIRKMGKLIFSKKGSAGDTFRFAEIEAEPRRDNDYDDSSEEDSSDDDDETKVDEEQPSQKRGRQEKQSLKQRHKQRRSRARHDPDALPPTKVVHYIGRFVAGVYNYILSPEGLFGLRMAIVSVATWIPQVVPASANFYYSNKGIWVLIMAQTGLTVSVGEQVFSTASRVLGTVLGGLTGAVMWYISAGSSEGNPVSVRWLTFPLFHQADSLFNLKYTFMLVGGIAFLVIVFVRINAPPIFLLPTMLFGITALIVYGYSWMSQRLVLRAHVGVGIEVFWRRSLLVIIGLCAAFAVLIVGRPLSTRSLVRRSTAGLTHDILRLYNLIIERFIAIDGIEDEDELSRHIGDGLHQRVRTQFIQANVRLNTLATQQIAMASLDFSPRGPWPKARYEQAARAQARLLEALAQLAQLLLEERKAGWFPLLASRSALLDPDLISEISLHLSLTSRSLSTGVPTPHAGTGGLQDLLIKMQFRANRVQKAKGENTKLNLDFIESPDFMKYVTGIMSLTTICRSIDELASVTAELVGEVPLEGFDALMARREKMLWDMSQRKQI